MASLKSQDQVQKLVDLVDHIFDLVEEDNSMGMTAAVEMVVAEVGVVDKEEPEKPEELVRVANESRSGIARCISVCVLS